MLISILAAFFGLVAGIGTGLTPGVHINLVASIVAGSLTALLTLGTPVDIGIFLLTMSVTHTFLDNIPAVFLGVAEGSEVLLPSQRMVMEGRGIYVVMLLTFGALGCLAVSVALIPLFVQVFPALYAAVKPHTRVLLCTILLLMIVRQKNSNTKFWSLFVILCAGALGLIVLRELTLNDPLLPLLGGMFGASGLIHSLLSRTALPEQTRRTSSPVNGRHAVASIMTGTFSGAAISLLPGLGPAQAAIAASALLPRLSEDAFIILTGGINTVNMVLSLATISSLGFARNGSLQTMFDIMTTLTPLQLTAFSAIALVAGGLAACVTIILAKPCSDVLRRLRYDRISIFVIILLLLLVGWRSSWTGILVFLTSTALGLVATLTGAPRHMLMAALMIPVISYGLM